MAMAAALLSHTTTAVWAAVTHVEGCNNTTHKYADCDRYVGTAVVKEHRVFSEAYGTYVTCTVQGEIYTHNMLCANSSCRVLMESGVAKTCTRYHSAGCDTERDVCKTE